MNLFVMLCWVSYFCSSVRSCKAVIVHLKYDSNFGKRKLYMFLMLIDVLLDIMLIN